MFKQQLAELPVPMERCRPEPEIQPKRLELFSLRQEKTDRADVTEIGAREIKLAPPASRNVAGWPDARKANTKPVRPFAMRSSIAS